MDWARRGKFQGQRNARDNEKAKTPGNKNSPFNT